MDISCLRNPKEPQKFYFCDWNLEVGSIRMTEQFFIETKFTVFDSLEFLEILNFLNQCPLIQ